MKKRPSEHIPGRVIMRNGEGGRWLEFTHPYRIISAYEPGAVLPLIRRLEAAVRQEGLHAAGFIS